MSAPDSFFSSAGFRDFGRSAPVDEPRKVPAAVASFKPTCAARPILHQYRPAWAVQAYLRIAEVPYHVQNATFPDFRHGCGGGSTATPGELPVLCDGHFLVPWQDVIPHLAREHKNVDKELGLSENALAEVSTYTTLLTTRLHAALLYCRWADDASYRDRTFPDECRVMPAPFRWYLVRQHRKRQVAALRAAAASGMLGSEAGVPSGIGHAPGSSTSEPGLPTLAQVKHDAHQAYKALSEKLSGGLQGRQRWLFHADSPCSVDALLFGHVADALADIHLSAVVHQYPLLVSHFERVRDAYFSAEARAGSDGSSNQPCSMNYENGFSTLQSAALTDAAGAFSVQASPTASSVTSAAGAATGPAPSPSARGPEVVPAPSKEEAAMAEGSRNAMVVAVLSVTAYLLWGIRFEIQFEDGGGDDDD